MFSSLISRLKNKRIQRSSNRRISIVFISFFILSIILFVNIIPVVSYTIVIENNVDSDSDIDATANKGTDGATSFLDAQTKNDIDQVIVEENQGGAGGSEWLDVTTDDNTQDVVVTNVGTTPFLDQPDQPTNYVWSLTNAAQAGWFYFGTTSLTGTITVNISVLCNSDDTDDYVHVYVDYTGSGAGADIGTAGGHTGWSYDTFDLGTHTVAEVNALRFWLDWVYTGAKDEVRVDYVMIGLSVAGSDNYQLEWEHQVSTPALDDHKDEYLLCVYGYSSSVTESFEILLWDWVGTTWSSALSTVITNTEQWYNQSVAKSYVDTTNDRITFLFRGTIESSDTIQDTLYLDYSGIRAFNMSAYGLPDNHDSLKFSPDSDYHAFIDSPLSLVIESGRTHDLQIKGVDGTGNPITNGYVYWNTVDNSGSSTQLTTSFVNFLTSQVAGNNTHSVYLWYNYGWTAGDGQTTDGGESYTLNITIVEL